MVDQAAATTEPRSRRRTPHPHRLAVLALCLALFALAYLRGTWADRSPRDPQGLEDGVISRLVVDEKGDRAIRTAVVLPVSEQAAWKVLCDYNEWERLFKTVRRNKVAEQLDEYHHHVVSEVMTPLGTVSLDFIVTHESTTDGGHLAWWDAPTHQLPVNRGTIRTTPLAADRTLLVYTVVKQWRIYPAFFVNNMLLNQQPDLVATLGKRIVEAASSK